MVGRPVDSGAAGRELTADEWKQYIGGTPHRLCGS
jgi:hypothetical protein